MDFCFPLVEFRFEILGVPLVRSHLAAVVLATSEERHDVLIEDIITILKGMPPLPRDVERIVDSFKEDDVTFYLFSREEGVKKVELSEANLDLVASENPVRFIVHGWGESAMREWYQDMTNEILKRDTSSVIQVDWSKFAGVGYVASSYSTQKVGK